SELKLEAFGSDLEKINGAGKHLLALINDILDLSKIEAGKMELYLESFDVGTLIEEVASTIRPMVKKNANTLHIERAEGLGAMHADQIKVRQGLYNLLSNAVKFTHDGTITLDASRQIMNDTEWIVFRVADTGIGLRPEQIVKLFQDFTQADASTTRKFGGTGLGLALTRRFCQMMGGDVTLQSVPGEGSVFTIKLPARVREAKPDAVPPSIDAVTLLSGGAQNVEGSESVPLPDTCVLVIDDDPAQRTLMRNFLSHEGFCVRTAAGGREGIRMATQMRPAAITLDVMMPDMDGWSVLTALKADETLRSIPVIMLTMVDDPERGFSLGAADYATKPLDRHRMSHILKRYSCGSPPCSVLVVEDDPATRAMTRNVLEKEGWRVTEAENGRIAMDCVEQNRPSLILLDLMMPEMDGYETTQAIRGMEEYKSLPIIAVTAKAMKGDREKTLAAGASDYITKPVDTEQLLSLMRVWLYR
ncbi:MAG: response regulator, partial [Gemmatimonadetes bacterium]|nr:response regulator [Gemmatimonadota bacterium]